MAGLSQNYCNRERAVWEREIEKRLLEAELNFNGYLSDGRLAIQSRGFIFPIPDRIDRCLAKVHRSADDFGPNDFPGRIDVRRN